MSVPRRSLAAVAAAALAAAAPPPAVAHDGAGAEHAGHSMKRATRTTVDAKLPAVPLVRDDGKEVTLPEELDDGRPVVLNFVFTSCATICPAMTRVFAQLQERLGPDRARVHMASISIDPEQDTPERLAAYAREAHAGPQWRFYTGAAEASVAVQRAMGTFRGDKMEHTPVTFLRAERGDRWVRIDGFASADELARELQGLLATR
jgi:protein SCO1/2